MPQHAQKTVDLVAAPDGQRRFGGEHDVSAAALEQVLRGQAPGGDIVHRHAVEQSGIGGHRLGERAVVADNLHASLGGPNKMSLANVARRYDDAAHAVQEHIVDKRGFFLFLAVGVAEQNAVTVNPRRAVDRMRQRRKARVNDRRQQQADDFRLRRGCRRRLSRPVAQGRHRPFDALTGLRAHLVTAIIQQVRHAADGHAGQPRHITNICHLPIPCCLPLACNL